MKAVTLLNHIDGSIGGSIFKYSNDHLDATRLNLRFKTSDGHVLVFATKDVHPGEELFIRYGRGHWLYNGSGNFLGLKVDLGSDTLTTVYKRKPNETICVLESPAMQDLDGLSKYVKFSEPLHEEQDPCKTNCRLCTTVFVFNTTLVVSTRHIAPGEPIFVHSKYRLRVSPSNVHNGGMGAFARVSIPSNTFLGNYSGNILSDSEYGEKRAKFPRIDKYAIRETTEQGVSQIIDPTDNKGKVSPFNTAIVCFINEPTNPGDLNCQFVKKKYSRFFSLYTTRTVGVGMEFLAKYPSGFVLRYPYS